VKPPERWLEAGDAAPQGAAELLSAAAPPPPFDEVMRARLGAGVAQTAALSTSSPWSSLLAKGAFVALIGGASGYAVHALAEKQDAAPPAASVVAAAPLLPSALLLPALSAVAVDSLPALQLPTAPPPAPKLKLDPRLEEAELLEQARSLVGSSPAQALKLTAQHAREFPKGRLGAEADLLAAQALLGMGDVAGAKQRAASSLKRYPNGIYARQLREIVAR
jgi:TolA-binding protein